MELIKYIKIIFFIAVSTLLACCINDDMSKCETDTGLGVRFSYTKNLEGINKFETEVDRVTLYIFDEQGYFVTSYHEEGYKPNSYIMEIGDLPAGEYTFVAWSFKLDEYNLPQLIPGVTNLDDLTLSFRSVNNVVVNYPYDLFYGSLFDVTITQADENRILDIDLVKDTKDIRVTIQGLPFDTPGTGSGIGGTDYNCIITSSNGVLRFDNRPTGGMLTYRPQGSLEGEDIIAEFVVLRECPEGCGDSRLIITQDVDGADRILLNVPLLPLLINASQTGNIDIEDYFELVVVFDYTSGSVTISINGWIVVEDGNIIVG